MKRAYLDIVLIIIAVFTFRCQEEENAPITQSVVGKWAGQTADIKANPTGIIPAFTIPDKPLPVVIEFKDNGTATLTDSNSKTYEGTYVQNEEKLSLQMDYKFEFLDLTGEYEIEELTNEKMKVTSTRSGTFDVPNYGQFDGTITATLHFARVSK